MFFKKKRKEVEAPKELPFRMRLKRAAERLAGEGNVFIKFGIEDSLYVRLGRSSHAFFILNLRGCEIFGRHSHLREGDNPTDKDIENWLAAEIAPLHKPRYAKRPIDYKHQMWKTQKKFNEAGMRLISFLKEEEKVFGGA